MEMNMVVLVGKLSTEAELRIFDSGVKLLRMLVVVHTEEPHKRVDVIPVVWWEPSEEALSEMRGKGQLVWVSGAIHRRFWEAPDGRRSRLEVVASNVTFAPDLEEEVEDAAEKANG